MAEKKQIKLGMEVKCIVTGFQGTVVSRTEYLNGCVRYGVEPKVGKDGKPAEAMWIDEQQLSIVKATTPATALVQQPTGGARPAPRGPAVAKAPRNPPR